jgi:hypothetical protein
MKKIVITSFVMPHELDDLERVLVDLNKASKFIDLPKLGLSSKLGSLEMQAKWITASCPTIVSLNKASLRISPFIILSLG